MNKKAIAVALSVMMAASVFTGSAMTVSADEKVETLEVLMYSDWYTDGWKALEQYIHDNSADLGFDISLSTMEGGDQGDSVWQVKFATEDLPDLGMFYTVQWVQSKCSGLDKLVDLTGIASTEEYEQSVIDAYTVDGKLLGMPINTSIPVGMWCNKVVLADCGIEEYPTTLAELEEDCAIIKEKGYTPIFFSGADMWSFGPGAEVTIGADAQRMYGNVQDFIDALGANEVQWTACTDTITELAFWKKMIQEGYVNETYMADTFENGQDALANGECAFYPMGSWVADNIQSKYPEKETEISAFMMPTESGENWVSLHMPYTLAVTTSCKDVELGKKVVDWIASSEAQQVYADAQAGLYLNKNVTSEVPASTNDLYQAGLEAEKLTNDWQEIVKYSYGNLQQYISDYYVSDEEDATVVMQAMDDETARNAKAAGDENWD